MLFLGCVNSPPIMAGGSQEVGFMHHFLAELTTYWLNGFVTCDMILVLTLPPKFENRKN